jgi:hypothetical protein
MDSAQMATVLSEAASLKQENEVLKERLAKLSEASISILANLDTETVLQHVIGNA